MMTIFLLCIYKRNEEKAADDETTPPTTTTFLLLSGDHPYSKIYLIVLISHNHESQSTREADVLSAV